MTVTTADPVGATLETVERALHGPRRACAELVREVRDGLDDAVAAYREAGMTEEQARRRAVADFGEPEEIAAELQVELTARYGLRTALRMTIAFPVMVLLWDTLWTTPTAIRPPDHSPLLAGLIDAVSLAAAVCCALAVLALYLGARRGLRADLVIRAIGAVVLGALVVVLFACGWLQPLSTADGGPAVGAHLLAVMALSGCAVAWLGVSAHRLLRLGRLASRATVVSGWAR